MRTRLGQLFKIQPKLPTHVILLRSLIPFHLVSAWHTFILQRWKFVYDKLLHYFCTSKAGLGDWVRLVKHAYGLLVSQFYQNNTRSLVLMTLQNDNHGGIFILFENNSAFEKRAFLGVAITNNSLHLYYFICICDFSS